MSHDLLLHLISNYQKLYQKLCMSYDFFHSIS